MAAMAMAEAVGVTAQLVCTENAQCDEHDGYERGHHTDGETGNCVCCRTGFGHFTDVGNGLGFHTHDGFDTRVVFRDEANGNSDNAAQNNGVHDPHLDVDQPLADRTVSAKPKETSTDEGRVSKATAGSLPFFKKAIEKTPTMEAM